MDIIRWMVLRVRSALIIYAAVWLISEALPIMSKVTETLQEGIANPKVTGSIAAGSGGTAIYDTVTQAAPDVLVFLSIIATGLTIWAHIGSRKRKRLEQEQKDEAHRAQMENEQLQKQLLQEQLREVSIRAEAQDMLVERLAKKHPEAAEEIAEETLDNIVSWNAKRKAN